MNSKRILVVYLALVAGLLLAATLVKSPASVAAGPPPTGTPRLIEVPSTFPLDLAMQPVGQPVRAVPMRLDLASPPPLTVRPALTITGTGWQKIMAENFEGVFPPSSWWRSDESQIDGGQYFWGKRDCKALSGAYSAWAGGGGSNGELLACGQTYADNLNTWLKYGPIDLSQATDAELQFDLWADIEGTGQNLIDAVHWGASIDGYSYHNFATAGQTGDWVPQNLDLDEAPVFGNLTGPGKPPVYLAWTFTSNSTNPSSYKGAFVDDAALWVYLPPSPTPYPPTPTLPITRHTTLADFAGGRSQDGAVVGAQQGDGGLTLAAQMTTLGNWGRLPSLPKELIGFEAVTAKGYLFVVGGSSPGGIQNRVYSALIEDDGTLEHWVEVTPLPQALAGHAVVVGNDHLFVLGGFNANGLQKTVFSVLIKDDGTLGEWQTMLPRLPVQLRDHDAVSTHGYIYVLGGRKSDQPLIVSDTIYRARINANGTLAGWETLPDPLPRPSQWHTVVAACDHLYLIGGADVTYEWNVVYQAEVYANGDLGVWSLASHLPKTLINHAATAIRGGLLVTGGWSSADPIFFSQKRVYWASLNSSCALGSWVELTPLPYGANNHALTATDRFVYNLGGWNATERVFASVLMAPLRWDSNLVPQGTFNHQFPLGNNYLIETLRWAKEGSGATAISLRYRVAPAGAGQYGPWSAYTSTSPVSINALGGYLEYELKFAGGNSSSDRRVSEISLDITVPPSVYLPLVVK